MQLHADARAVIPSDHQAPETPVSVGYIFTSIYTRIRQAPMAKKVLLLYYSCTLTAATDALASYPGSVKVSVL